MISIQDGKLQIFGERHMLELEAISLIDGMVRADLLSDETLKDIADAIYESFNNTGKYSDLKKLKESTMEYRGHATLTADEVEKIFGFNPAKGEKPKQLSKEDIERLVNELGINGMNRKDIIRQNLRKAMEDEWKE